MLRQGRTPVFYVAVNGVQNHSACLPCWAVSRKGLLLTLYNRSRRAARGRWAWRERAEMETVKVGNTGCSHLCQANGTAERPICQQFGGCVRGTAGIEQGLEARNQMKETSGGYRDTERQVWEN